MAGVACQGGEGLLKAEEEFPGAVLLRRTVHGERSVSQTQGPQQSDLGKASVFEIWSKTPMRGRGLKILNPRPHYSNTKLWKGWGV